MLVAALALEPVKGVALALYVRALRVTGEPAPLLLGPLAVCDQLVRETYRWITVEYGRTTRDAGAGCLRRMTNDAAHSALLRQD